MTSIIKVDNIQNASGTSALEIDSSGIVALSDVGQGQFYKAGTFNPVIADAITGGNVSSTSPVFANYVKIGKLVFIHIRFTNISNSGLTGANAMYIRGLPYNTNEGNPAFVTWVQDLNLDYIGNPIARAGQNNTWVRLELLRDNDSDHAVIVSDIETGNTDIEITGYYMTDDDA